MKKLIKILPILIFCMVTSVKAASALPHFTIAPSTGDYTKDSNIEVKFGAISDTKKVSGLDAMIEYDASKLEIVGNPTKVTADFEVYPNKISDGKILVSLIKASAGSDFDATALNGEVLFTITFKAKAEGKAQVNFTPTVQDSMGDSNILTREGGAVVDIISKADNDAQTGIYNIGAASGGTTSNTTINNNTTNITQVVTPVQTAKKTELPKTGNTAVTIGLFLLGGIGLVGGFLLKAL